MEYEYKRYLEHALGMPQDVLYNFVEGLVNLHKALALMTEEQRGMVYRWFPEAGPLAVTYGQIADLRTDLMPEGQDHPGVTFRNEHLRVYCHTSPELELDELKAVADKHSVVGNNPPLEDLFEDRPF